MSEKEKSAGQLLKEKLFRSPKNAGSTLSEEELKAAFDYCEPYKEFISTCKTEREFIDWVIPVLEKEGFVPFEPGKKYVAGDKVYVNNRNKAFMFAKIGRIRRSGFRDLCDHPNRKQFRTGCGKLGRRKRTYADHQRCF